METFTCRSIDKLGRLSLPKELRNQLQLQEGDELEFFIDDNHNNLILKKVDKQTSAGL